MISEDKGKVGIVLVNYNGEKFQNDCIRTLKKSTYNNYEIIVVDNNSTDNSIKLLREEFPNTVIIETGENTGVARGNNIGIKHALENKCEYVLLLNNDTEVDKEMLKKMVDKADQETLVTCKMYYHDPDNLIWCAGGEIKWSKGTTLHYGEGKYDEFQFNESKYVEYTPTCCLLVHRSVFENIGLMDEKYFMYYDDTDFCVRVNRAGFKIWYEASALLWHKVSSSSGGSESPTSIYYGNRNRLYFIDKFYNRKLTVTSFYFLSRSIKFLSMQSRQQRKALVQSIKDYYSGRMYIRK